VLAQAVELDVLDQDHLGAVLVEHALADHLGDALVRALGQLVSGALDALGRALQALARRVLAELAEELVDEPRYGARLGP
jgi:hypothetical protein